MIEMCDLLVSMQRSYSLLSNFGVVENYSRSRISFHDSGMTAVDLLHPFTNPHASGLSKDEGILVRYHPHFLEDSNLAQLALGLDPMGTI